MQSSLFDEASQLPSRVGRAEVGERPAASIFTRGKGRTAAYDWTLNPYTGCGFACSYCYAAFFVADDDRRERWGEWVDVKTRAEREILSKRGLRGAKVHMSSATDPYQPVEAKIGHTRRIVELLADPIRQPRLIVQTRSPLASRDIDLFRRFARLRVNMSITTDDDATRKRFEPWCASIDRRFAAIEEIAAAGIPVAVCISPMLPITDPEAFARRLASIGAVGYVASPFHPGTQPFAAGTREGARSLLAQIGWTNADHRATVEAMRCVLPTLDSDHNAFAPV